MALNTIPAVSTDVTKVPLSTVTATGDLIVATGSGAVTNLAAGTSGYALTANGAGAAPTYQAIPTGGITLLSTTTYPTTSGSSVTLSSISQSYKHLKIVITGINSTGGNATLPYMYFNGDTSTSNYRQTMINASVGTITNPTGTANGAIYISPSAMGAGGNGGVNYSTMDVDIYRYTSTDPKTAFIRGYGVHSNYDYWTGIGNWANPSAQVLSSITFITSGLQAGGTIYLYGVN